MTDKRSINWRPYWAGALVGLLAIGSAVATTRMLGKTQFLGASTTLVRMAGYAEQTVAPATVAENPYYVKTAPRVDWQFMLVLGVVLGALLGAASDRSFKFESVPPIWRERFGGSVGKRALGAIGGGILAGFGARLADGCPSGHGLSGLMMLAVSGFIALAFFFGIGALAAHFIYRRKSS